MNLVSRLRWFGNFKEKTDSKRNTRRMRMVSGIAVSHHQPLLNWLSVPDEEGPNLLVARLVGIMDSGL